MLILLFEIGISFVALWQDDSQQKFERPMAEDISMRIVEGSLSRNGCTVLIREGNPPKGIGHLEFRNHMVDVYEDNEWKPLKLKTGATYPDFDFTADQEVSFLPTFLLDPENSVGEFGEVDLKVDWAKMYGSLENGEYRLVKWIGYYEDKRYFYVPFSIDDKVP